MEQGKAFLDVARSARTGTPAWEEGSLLGTDVIYGSTWSRNCRYHGVERGAPLGLHAPVQISCGTEHIAKGSRKVPPSKFLLVHDYIQTPCWDEKT